MRLLPVAESQSSVPVYSLLYFSSTEDGDRHGRPDGCADRPRGGRGPEPGLPEGGEAEALSQAEEVRRMEWTWSGEIPKRWKRWKQILPDLSWLVLYFSLQKTDLKNQTQISSWVSCGAARSQSSHWNGTRSKDRNCTLKSHFSVPCLHQFHAVS